MTYRFEMIPASEKDFDELVAYFMESANFVDNARIKAESFYEQMRSVVDYPRRFLCVTGNVWNGQEARYKVIGRSVVFFEIDEELSVVRVLRILDYRQDLKDYFGVDHEQD